MNDTPLPALPDEEAERLVARIVERAALPSDYDAFATLARQGPDRWQRLLDSLRDDDALHLALQESLTPAERVTLPAAPPTPRAGLRPWTGWLAAAALALAWLSADLGRSEPAAPAWPLPLAGAPLHAASGPADPVLAELPPRLVATSPAAGGAGYDVLYVQPVLRRARVDQVIGLGSDEHGRPAPVPLDPATLARHENF